MCESALRENTDWFFPKANARQYCGNNNLSQQRTIAYSKLSKYNNFVCRYHIFAVCIFQPVRQLIFTNSRSKMRGAGRAEFWSVDVLLV